VIDLASYLPGFLAAYSILLVGASSPGPAVAMLLGISMGQGRGPALIACGGIASGSMTINILTMLGVGLILSQAAWAMAALRLIGGGYLLWLAYGAFRKAAYPPKISPLATVKQPTHRLFFSGYLLQVTNPKAILFWLAIAAIGATDGGGALIVMLFVLGAFVLSFLCHAAWALILSATTIRAAYTHSRRWIEAVLGCFFTIFAYKLATSES
jgi:threonine/homoserine/homoserine lactone efflux protein